MAQALNESINTILTFRKKELEMCGLSEAAKPKERLSVSSVEEQDECLT